MAEVQDVALAHVDLHQSVEITSVGPELDPHDQGIDWIDSSIINRDLRVLGASVQLASEAAGLAKGRRASPLGLNRLRQLVDVFRESGEWGEIVNRERVRMPVPVVAAGTPNAPGAESSGEFTFAKSSGGGLSLKLAGIGFQASAKYTITQGIEVVCEVAEAKVANLLVPIDAITQQYRPPAGHEWLTVVRYEAVPGEPIGAGADISKIEELLEYGVEAPVPLRGNASFSGSQQRDLEVSFSFEVGFGGEDESASLSLSAELSGTVSVGYEFDLPAGDFNLYWLRGPAGACVMTEP